MKVFDKFHNFPPVLIRLLARVPHGRPLTTGEIALASRLPIPVVDNLSQQTDWRHIDIPTARAFMLGCGVDITHEPDYRRVRVYLKSRNPRNPFPYLKRSALWQTYYLPLIQRYAQSTRSIH